MEIIGFSLIGILAGVAGGLLGIGGAVIIIPLLVFIYGFDQKLAQGTTLVMMIPPIGLMAAIEYYRADFVNMKAAIIMAIFFFLGGWLGGKIAIKIDPVILRKVFACFLMLISIKMLIK
jgi:uncharacterized membrane protein YfcA